MRRVAECVAATIVAMLACPAPVTSNQADSSTTTPAELLKSSQNPSASLPLTDGNPWPSTWTVTPCRLPSTTSLSLQPKDPHPAAEHKVAPRNNSSEVWFATVGDKLLPGHPAPTTTCQPPLRMSGAAGERVTFQLGVRASGTAPLRGVVVALDWHLAATGPTATEEGIAGADNDAGAGGGENQRAETPKVVVRRAGFTNVSTAANNVTSAGVGMHPDPLPFPNNTLVFPSGGDVVLPGSTAVFWVTIDLRDLSPPATATMLNATLSVFGTSVAAVPVSLLLWPFALPDPAHASQWTEADPFGSLEACNTVAVDTRPPGCPTNRTNFPHNEKPCLESAVVDAYFDAMAENRVNRLAWAVEFDMAAPVHLTIAADTQSVTLDTTAFDTQFSRLVSLGYRDIRFPVPACTSGSTCGLDAAGGVNPNATWVFGNSTGWYGNCPAKDHSSEVTCVSGFPPQTLVVPIFANASLNAPSARNASLASWETQLVGDRVDLNPEFVRLFRLVMEPMAAHLKAKGWINRTFAFIADEPQWPCYNNGHNFTVNAWVQFTSLFKSLDPAIRVQQDLAPMADGPIWKAVSPLVDAWVWQEGQFQFGVASGTGAKAARIENQLALIAKARERGADAYIYNNGIAIVDLHAHRVRTFPWQIWRTNYAYNVSRHAGLQGSLSWFALTAYFGSNPWEHANVLCADPLGQSANPIKPNPHQGPCLQERGAGEWYTLYPPVDFDICHKGPVPSIRWELLRKGLEDVEYLAMLDRLAGAADQSHHCGYEAAVLQGPTARVPPSSNPCCASLAVAKGALDSVDTVTWGITATGYGPSPGDPPYNVSESEPYTREPLVLQGVLDSVAHAIVAVQQACPPPGTADN